MIHNKRTPVTSPEQYRTGRGQSPIETVIVAFNLNEDQSSKTPSEPILNPTIQKPKPSRSQSRPEATKSLTRYKKFEEATEVVEPQILATPTPSRQHLILIGDHLQLRPQIQTYSVSSDSPIGRDYNLDVSLMERRIGQHIGIRSKSNHTGEQTLTKQWMHQDRSSRRNNYSMSKYQQISQSGLKKKEEKSSVWTRYVTITTKNQPHCPSSFTKAPSETHPEATAKGNRPEATKSFNLLQECWRNAIAEYQLLFTLSA
ncbi:MAG: hypothetical protein J3Q66DRAFT_363015 [Benniella sp.]|nr:MAG: hypothetical protein J3Q66DRAFT_363015 [Benniella sp.]